MTHRIYADESDCGVFKEAFLGDLAPFNDPANHLLAIDFHSALDNYALAMPPQIVPIVHPAQPASTPATLSSIEYNFTVYLGRFTTPIPLLHHGLGYVPFTVVLDENKYAVPNAFPIQRTMSGSFVVGHRQISIYTNSADVVIKDIVEPGNAAMPLLNKTYTVYLFKPPIADPAKDMLRVGDNEAVFGQGKFDLATPRLRRAVTGETADLLIPRGRMTDIANGAARYVNGDGTFQDISASSDVYTGSFAGSSVIPAVMV